MDEDLSSKVLSWLEREFNDDFNYQKWKNLINNEKIKKWLTPPFDEIWNFYITRTVSKKNINKCIIALKLHNKYDEEMDVRTEKKLKKYLVDRRAEIKRKKAEIDSKSNKIENEIKILTENIQKLNNDNKNHSGQILKNLREKSVFANLKSILTTKIDNLKTLNSEISKYIIKDKENFTSMPTAHDKNLNNDSSINLESISDFLNKISFIEAKKINQEFKNFQNDEIFIKKFYYSFIHLFNQFSQLKKQILIQEDSKNNLIEKISNDKISKNDILKLIKIIQLEKMIECAKKQEEQSRNESSTFSEKIGILNEESRTKIQKLNEKIMNVYKNLSNVNDNYSGLISKYEKFENDIVSYKKNLADKITLICNKNISLEFDVSGVNSQDVCVDFTNLPYTMRNLITYSSIKSIPVISRKIVSGIVNKFNSRFDNSLTNKYEDLDGLLSEHALVQSDFVSKIKSANDEINHLYTDDLNKSIAQVSMNIENAKFILNSLQDLIDVWFNEDSFKLFESVVERR